MAGKKGNLLRCSHTQMGQVLDEFEASCAAEKAAAAKDKVLDPDGPESEVRSPDDEHQGAMDARSRRGVPMSRGRLSRLHDERRSTSAEEVMSGREQREAALNRARVAKHRARLNE